MSCTRAWAERIMANKGGGRETKGTKVNLDAGVVLLLCRINGSWGEIYICYRYATAAAPVLIARQLDGSRRNLHIEKTEPAS